MARNERFQPIPEKEQKPQTVTPLLFPTNDLERALEIKIGDKTQDEILSQFLEDPVYSKRVYGFKVSGDGNGNPSKKIFINGVVYRAGEAEKYLAGIDRARKVEVKSLCLKLYQLRSNGNISLESRLVRTTVGLWDHFGNSDEVRATEQDPSSNLASKML